MREIKDGAPRVLPGLGTQRKCTVICNSLYYFGTRESAASAGKAKLAPQAIFFRVRAWSG